MKPKRPTETDLLAIVQNGFQEQLPRDRETQATASVPAILPEPEAKPAAIEPAPAIPMVRITLAIPEDMRFRLKVAVMNHRRRHRDRMTQDEFCAQAIAALLDQEERGGSGRSQADPLAAFLKDCLSEGALTRGWAPKARALLADLGRNGRLVPSS